MSGTISGNTLVEVVSISTCVSVLSTVDALFSVVVEATLIQAAGGAGVVYDKRPSNSSAGYRSVVPSRHVLSSFVPFHCDHHWNSPTLP